MPRASGHCRPSQQSKHRGSDGLWRVPILWPMALEYQYARLLYTAAFFAVVMGLTVRMSASPPLIAATASSPSRTLYAVNQSSASRGSISVYDIDRGHSLIKTIPTVSNVDDVKGVAVSAATGKLYVTYRTRSGVGMIYCLSIRDDAVLWNRVIDPDVDRLSIHPNGKLLYVPTWEGGSTDHINVLDADSGDLVRKVHFSNRSHDTQFPLSGPLFQTTKATDGSGTNQANRYVCAGVKYLCSIIAVFVRRHISVIAL